MSNSYDQLLGKNVKLINGVLRDDNGNIISLSNTAFDIKTSSINKRNIINKKKIKLKNIENSIKNEINNIKNSEFYDNNLISDNIIRKNRLGYNLYNNNKSDNDYYNSDNNYQLQVEWWDIPYLKDKTINNYINLETNTINCVDNIPLNINHNFNIQKDITEKQSITFKTKAEQKKIKKLKKQEAIKKLHEKIKYGLIDPPEPKLKQKNYLNILKDEAINDPTKIEELLKKNINDRLAKHNEKTLKNKKTKDNLKSKLVNKALLDLNNDPNIIFVIVKENQKNLVYFLIKFIKDFGLKGYIIIYNEPNNYNMYLLLEIGQKYLKILKNNILRKFKDIDYKFIGKRVHQRFFNFYVKKINTKSELNDYLIANNISDIFK